MKDDTAPSARDAQVVWARQLNPIDRFRRAAEMSEEARQISVEAERRRHPELSEHEARQVVFARMWGAELAARVSSSKLRDR